MRYFSDRIMVMYLGRIVETGPAAEVWSLPLHPYTRLLLASVPRTGGRGGHRGQAFRSAGVVAGGCRFAPRCPLATGICRTHDPALREIAPGHAAACHHAERAPALAA